jgi:hypothetical protein
MKDNNEPNSQQPYSYSSNYSLSSFLWVLLHVKFYAFALS